MKRFYILPNKLHGLHTGVLNDNGNLSAAQFIAPGTAKRLQAFRSQEIKTLRKIQKEACQPEVYTER